MRMGEFKRQIKIKLRGEKLQKRDRKWEKKDTVRQIK